jgi:putative tryptophan/tyrosine transport system substrate-binding protein
MQLGQLNRRKFIRTASGVAAWPLAARGQQAMPVIGYFSTGSLASDESTFLRAFRQGIAQTGYVEGRNVAIEYGWGEFQYDRLPTIVASLVRHQVAAIAAIGGTPTALAAKAATSTIPIVIYSGIDFVETGLIASFNRPGGNVTGIAALQSDLIKKRVQVLHEFAPQASLVAVLVNPKNPYTEPEMRAVHDAASSLGLRLHVLYASNTAEIDAAFGTLAELRAGALLVSADLYLTTRRQQFVALSARHALPVMYPWREYVDAGGLMSYGPNNFDANRLIGVYIGKILRGASPADLPVEQITKVEFLINLKTSNKLGVAFPTALLVRADEVIE